MFQNFRPWSFAEVAIITTFGVIASIATSGI